MKSLLLVILSLECVLTSPIIGDSYSFVISTTEAPRDRNDKDETVVFGVNPQISSIQIYANINHRFASTLIISKVKNLRATPEETTFEMILPENAFISTFEMECKDKSYKAYVKEKEQAKNIYQKAVSRGRSAAHVGVSARDSQIFTVSVNIEPESETIFRLVYEELLLRKRGQYELVININPGQIVDDLRVQVHINESPPLAFVRTPSLRTGKEIGDNDAKLNPSAEIHIDGNSASVKFIPDVSQQKEFGQNLGGEKEKGLAGQFVVQYDVERDSKGEVLIRDGYFVHFFAPSDLKPLPKHVVFVLDHSGSMLGRKIEQLIEAMKKILSELKTEDLFHLVYFSSDVSVWNSQSDKFEKVASLNGKITDETDDVLNVFEDHFKSCIMAKAAKVTPEMINKAKKIIEDQNDLGTTNIFEGLEVGLILTMRTQKQYPDKFQPMIVFLTDGYPNVGMTSPNNIIKAITELNSVTKVHIFALSFGEDADKEFLRNLCLLNFGFSRHIFEAADAAIQLQDFYSTISSPLLSNITFKYVDSVSQVTKAHYPILFEGSELVVAGKIVENSTILPQIRAVDKDGSISFNTTYTKPVGSLERLWAYLTVKQTLEEKEVTKNNTELTKKALDLSLKYSFVTSVSSLVVVKPDEIVLVDTFSTNSDKSTQQSIFEESAMMGPEVTRKSDNMTLPPWLDYLYKNNVSLITPQGDFKLGHSGDVNVCPQTPLGGPGECKILFDCPQVFSILTDLDVYLQYFCPLNNFVGVCCPGAPQYSIPPA